MAGKRDTGSARAAEKTGEEEDEGKKAELQRRMEDARESISQTVTEIKDTVSNQYQAVKESVAETLDWREQFRRRPVAWSVGALSVGLIAGYGLTGGIKDSEAFKRVQEEIADLGDRLLDEMSGIGDRVTDELAEVGQQMVPALTAAALPIVINQLKELIGVDLSDAAKQLSAGRSATKSKARTGKGRKKKSSTAKGVKRKSVKSRTGRQ